jgi:CheY-like chemotaxis protein
MLAFPPPEFPTGRGSDAVPEQTNRTVLVVEGSAADRELVRGLLQQQPRKYTVLQAAMGAEGLARCQDTRLD